MSSTATWQQVAKQLQEAGLATRRVTDALTGVACCQPEIGMTPAGVPFTVHEPACRGLEERLALAVMQVPTDTEREMETQCLRMAELARRLYRLTGDLRRLAGKWRDREANPRPNRSEAYQLGETNAWGTAAAQLEETLNHPEVD